MCTPGVGVVGRVGGWVCVCVECMQSRCMCVIGSFQSCLCGRRESARVLTQAWAPYSVRTSPTYQEHTAQGGRWLAILQGSGQQCLENLWGWPEPFMFTVYLVVSLPKVPYRCILYI